MPFSESIEFEDYSYLLSELVLEKSFRKGHFVLRNGRHTNIFFDKTKLIYNVRLLEIFVTALVPSFKDVPKSAIIIAPATGAISTGIVASKLTGHRLCVLEKSGNVFNLPAGLFLPRNTPVIIIDDVFNTGESMLRAIDCCKHVGLDVRLCACLVDKSFNLPKLSYPLVSALRYPIKEYEPSHLPDFLAGIPPTHPSKSVNVLTPEDFWALETLPKTDENIKQNHIP